MQELVINGLLTVVILTAVILRFFIGTRADSGMTKKQKTMLTRILIAAAMLLGLQFLSAETVCGALGAVFLVPSRLLHYWL